MKIKFDKAYEPKHLEAAWYDRWLEGRCFDADPDQEGPTFSIVIPPPNVTGSLHVGHALNNTLQDIIVRFHRMDGHTTLWMPGTDHAGIATQNVVERALAEKGQSRVDLGREAFVAEVWKWKEKFGGTIVKQLKRLGASCDWRRQRFTLDEGLSRAVRKVFVTLYNEQFIYRGNYIINWCPRCETALSDLEVVHEELPGKLYSILYPLADEATDSRRGIVVATTRPETLLGDMAVAVHPSDRRYKRVVGRELILPLTGRSIPIVADDMVKKDFGSGAVKVTPAHDFNDFEVGLRHDLPAFTILAADATIDLPGSDYHGLTTSEARSKIVADLESHGLLVGTKEHQHMVGHCYRCHTVVEPRVSQQWFVRMQELAKPALESVRNGDVRFTPSNWENVYFEWMENIKDWCISRQIWWGHQIPAWNCQECDALIVDEEDPSSCAKCGHTKLRQESDVLDTWFSSALWPFSTMGWPDKAVDTAKMLKSFYPNSLLITSFDIIFFWVARMIMMGLKFQGRAPFHEVYIHALVRDEHGQKMSKSKGNVVDPLDLMERYGTDALRFTLTALTVQGRDIALAEDRINGYRNFMNKIWNASRFVCLSLEQLADKLGGKIPVPEVERSGIDLWINRGVRDLIRDTRSALREMRFNEIAQKSYQFFWHEYCDWYIELTKSHLQGDVNDPKQRARAIATAHNLIDTLDSLVRLLHPVIPFVTEDIWQKISALRSSSIESDPSWTESEFLMTAQFPKAEGWQVADDHVMADLELVKEFIGSIRACKSENQIAPSKQIEVIVHGAGEQERAAIDGYREYIDSLARLKSLEYATAEQADPPGPVATTVVRSLKLTLPLGDLIDLDKERKRVEREMTKLISERQRIEGKLNNNGFLQGAPSEVVQKERNRLREVEEKQRLLGDFYHRLKGS